MNKFDSFFDNLLPLRPLIPFVQSVLPTVFDDSLSYLETLGKVVKALNDSMSNVNTLEQAVRAFADDLGQYENLSITPVNVVFNNDTGTYTASMTYADIVSALNEGHTVIMHVTGSVYDTGIEFYSAALKAETTSGNVRVLYWDSPVYIVDGNTVVYRAFINENNVPGVLRRVIDGETGSTTLFVRYDSTQGNADKTYAEIMQAINNGDGVVLIADGYYISPARVAETFVEFVTGSLVSYSNGYNLGVILYTVTNNDDWSVLRRGFPDTVRVDAMIDAKIDGLEGFNSIATLNYNESTGAVTYFDGAQTVNVTGYDINSRFLNNPKMLPVMLGFTRVGNDGALFAYYFPVRYGTVGNDEVVEFYRVFNGNYELVSVPWSSNIAVKTSTPIGGGSAPYKIPVSVSGGVYSTTATGAEIFENRFNCYAEINGVMYYPVGCSTSGPVGDVYLAAVDPHTAGSYDVEILQFHLTGANNIATVTRYSNDITTLPDTTNANADDFLMLDSNKNPAWVAVPNAANVSFGGV
jgi:hypothetical protein